MMNAMSLLVQIAEVLSKGDASSYSELKMAKNAFKHAVSSIASEIEIIRREIWTYERETISLPPHLNEESIDVRIDVQLEGSLILSVDHKKREELQYCNNCIISRLLDALERASVEDLRVALLDDDEGRITEDDISVNELSREISITPSFGGNLSDICVEDSWAYLKEDRSKSVQIEVVLSEVDIDDEFDELTGSVFSVGCPFVDSQVTENTLGCTSVLGELEPFWGWSPSTVSSDVGEKGWAYWLASRIRDVI
jgi:hypothetical protein